MKIFSTACQRYDGDTIEVGLINNAMPYQEMFRRKILNYSALDFGQDRAAPKPLPFHHDIGHYGHQT